MSEPDSSTHSAKTRAPGLLLRPAASRRGAGPTVATPAPAPLLTTFQAAKELGVVFSTVNYWVDEGTLPGFRTPGGHRRIRRDDLEAFKVAYSYGRAPRSRTLLVVDDDRSFRRALVRRVKREGLAEEIVEADNGFDAGRFIVEKKPMVVILDIHLPGIDGFEVMRAVASMAHHPRIVAISGHSPVQYRKRALRLGASAFFAKPIATDEFLSVIRALLEQKVTAHGD